MRILDTAWRNLYGSLTSWNNTATPANPDPVGTQKLMALLFSDGLTFIRAKYNTEWQESQSRLDALTADLSCGQTIATIGLQVQIQAVADAHLEYGVALGITEVKAAPDTTAVRDALSALFADLRVYVLQSAAYAYSRAANAKTLVDALLEPLAVWLSPEPQKSSSSTVASTDSTSASTDSTSASTDSTSASTDSNSASTEGVTG